MKDDNYKTPEQLAKEEAYREYLRLREEANPERKPPSITDTPYGASEMRKKMKEQQQEEQQRQEYLKAREASKKEPRPRFPHRERKDEPEAKYANAPGHSPEVTGAVRSKRKRKKDANRGLKRVLAIVIILVLGIAVLFGGAFAVAAGTLSKIGNLKIDKNEIAICSQAQKNLKAYTNIAVLGVDARNVEDDKNCRSDAIVVVSINNKTNEIKMFSVFRDTLLDVGGDVGLDKITHAYFYGGAQQSLYTLNKNLDLNIRKAIVINWKTVAEVIDSLGGIKIDVQESEIEEMNKYIPGTAKSTGSEKKLIEKPGKQTLNGAQAVTYARIRKDAATGDYRRNERMKVVMATTFKKMKKADLLELKKICDNALPQAKTNLSTGEMMSMALNFKKYKMTSSTTGWPYDVAAWMGSAGAGYAWYGPPQTLYSNVVKLYDKFFGIKDYEPSEQVQTISENISALTGIY